MMAYSENFRKKVLEVMKMESLTPWATSQRFKIDLKAVRRWMATIKRKIHSNRYRKLCLDALKSDVLEYPDGYQYERAKRLGVGQNAIFHGLQKLGISYKKNAYTPEGRRDKAYFISKQD